MKDNRYTSSIIYGILVVIFLAFQALQIIKFWDVYPDFILILTLIFALSRGSFSGEIFGFFTGFALDLMSGTMFGLNAFILTLFGALATPFQKLIKVSGAIVFIIYVSLATFLKYMFYTVFYSLYENTALLDWFFLIKIPGEIVVNIIIGVILYIIIARFDLRDNYDWF